MGFSLIDVICVVVVLGIFLLAVARIKAIAQGRKSCCGGSGTCGCGCNKPKVEVQKLD